MRQDRSPSLGKQPRRVPAGKTDCGTPPTHIPDSADPGSPPSPNPCRPAVASSHANRRGEASAQPGTNRSRAQSAVPGSARRRRRGNELTWRSAAGVLTCRVYPWPPYLGSCLPTTQRVDVCARLASSPTHFEPCVLVWRSCPPGASSSRSRALESWVLPTHHPTRLGPCIVSPPV